LRLTPSSHQQRIGVPANARRQEPFFMADNYIIENRPKSTGVTVQAGVVVRDGSGFRFFAATHPFNSLEGRTSRAPVLPNMPRYAASRTHPQSP
jgi:hypothetical protein